MIILIWGLLWGAVAGASTLAACPLKPGEKEKIQSCLKSLQEYNCEAYSTSSELKNKVSTCHIDEIRSSVSQDIWDIGQGCNNAIKNAVEEIRKNYKKGDEICEQITKSNQYQYFQSKIKKEPTRREYWEQFERETLNEDIKKCKVSGRGFVKATNAHIPWSELWDGIKEMNRQAHCFKLEHRAELLCPLAPGVLGLGTTVIVGAVGVGNFVRSSLIRTEKWASVGNRKINEVKHHASQAKEHASIVHQQDLLDASSNPKLAKRMSDANLDIQMLRDGMIDSDMGKLRHYSAQMTDGSTQSRDFIRILQGKGKEPETSIVKDIFKESGMGGRTLLPSHLEVDAVENVLKSNPALSGYLHELPGIRNAFTAFEKGEINASQLKIRIKANLFHNGPHEGYWQNFGENMVPVLLKDKDENTRSFLKGTVFEGEVKDNVISARYPSPISAEGIFHSTMDRMSQGTRVGMLKILDEVGGTTTVDNPKVKLSEWKVMNPNINGMGQVQSVLKDNIDGTLRQLEALKKNTFDMKNLNPMQKSALIDIADASIERLKKTKEYIKKSVKFSPDGVSPPEKIILEYKDANGKKIKTELDGQVSFEKAKIEIENMLLHEEKINGHPLRDLNVKPKFGGVAVTGAVSAAAIVVPASLTCSRTKTMPSSKPGTH